jgi:hypothetical protein
MVTKPKTYVETMTDVRKEIRLEVDAERRKRLQENLDRIDEENAAMRETITNLRIAAANSVDAKDLKDIVTAAATLKARVDSLDWLVRIVIVATVCEIIAGTFIAFVVHGLGGKS